MVIGSPLHICARLTTFTEPIHNLHYYLIDMKGRVGFGARSGEVAMKTSLIILTVTVLIVGALAVMNNACKSGQHAWCAPMSTVRNHIKP
jgi:hypothetical protein